MKATTFYSLDRVCHYPIESVQSISKYSFCIMSYSYIYKERKPTATKNDVTLCDNNETKTKFATKKVTRNIVDPLTEISNDECSIVEGDKPISSNCMVGFTSKNVNKTDIVRQDNSICAGITIHHKHNPNSNKSVHNSASAASMWFQKKRDKSKSIAANLLKEVNFNEANVSNSDNSIDNRYNETGKSTISRGQHVSSNSISSKFPPASIGTKIVRQCEICKMLYTSFHACDNPGDDSCIVTNKPTFASK